MPEQKTTPRRGIYLLPNLLTTGALFAGFYAIVAAMNGQFVTAAEAVVVASVLDGLDGRVARMTGTSSEFGVQFDSLSDLISFGLAPSLIMYLWALSSLSAYGVAMGKLGWVAAFLFTACAALRLARFNAQAGVADKRFFQGLSSPAAAGGIITMVWMLETEGISGTDVNLIALPVTLALGLLMVSNVRYYSFKIWPDKVPFLWVLALVLVLAMLAIDPPKALFVIAYGYALSGPAYTLFSKRQRQERRARKKAAIEEES